MLQNRRGITLAAAVLGANLISMGYGIYFVSVQGRVFQPTLFGLILVAALVMNTVLIYFNYIRGGRPGVQKWGKIYLLLSPPGLMTMSLGGYAASSAYDPGSSVVILFLTVYPAFLAILMVGALHARLTITDLFSGDKRPRSFPARGTLTGRRKALLAVLYLCLASGFFFTYILFTDYPGLLQVPIAPNALYLALIYPAPAVLILKVYGNPRSPVGYITTAAGLGLLAAFMLPLIMTPVAAARAEAEFKSVFGEEWRKRLEPSLDKYFLTGRFSLPAYFLGFPPGEYSYRKHILFYEGRDGVDEGLQLYFDVFMPPEEHSELPGEGSTIIRIHGGAWISGDKGPSNMLQINKYLAAQGYTVFDIQYGLTNRINLPQIMVMHDFLSSFAHLIPQSSSFLSSVVSSGATGSFTLDDIMRHLGIFTEYLAQHAGEYGASLDSVFVSGASAGGHLATAMSLAMAGGEYYHIFNPEITVKGYIPFYPANKAVLLLESIGGSAEWLDVELLIKQDSPPCLIFQGEKDGMVPADTVRSFKDRCREAGNGRCAVLYLPLAAHASDYLFAGYYNQLFLYYLERFLALYR